MPCISDAYFSRGSLLKTDFSLPQQGIASNAIVYSNHALTSNPEYNGSYPLILLGPNTVVEASVVLKLVRFYRKLMVRHVITSIIVPRGTSRYGSRGMDCTVSINRGSL